MSAASEEMAAQAATVIELLEVFDFGERHRPAAPAGRAANARPARLHATPTHRGRAEAVPRRALTAAAERGAQGKGIRLELGEPDDEDKRFERY
jgi:hypothetical protein